MKVTLIDYTGAGSSDPARYAANLLLFTKSTRLNMNPELLKDIGNWNQEKYNMELYAMSRTIPSSWEFIHFTFLIEDVTRAFTQQLERTRHASFAEQSLRVVKKDNWNYGTGPSIEGNKVLKEFYDNAMKISSSEYTWLIDHGARIEDARGVLPLNVLTNVVMKIDMRNWINLARKRASLRVQDEYRHVVDAMIIEVEKVYNWFHIFYKSDEMRAFNELQQTIFDSKLTQEEKTEIYKRLDIIKGEL